MPNHLEKELFNALCGTLNTLYSQGINDSSMDRASSIISKYEKSQQETSYLFCPFCGDCDFDLIGPKSHLSKGECEPYNNIENLNRTF